jgi:hypothetical protein
MGAASMASGETSEELARSQRDQERSMGSSHDAPLSEVWILRVLCNASDTFRRVALGKSRQRSMSLFTTVARRSNHFAERKRMISRITRSP